MTVRELLERAARAAKHEYDEMTECWSSDGINWEQWSPLEDDGDAFRLMVDCGMAVHQVGHKVHAVKGRQFDEYHDNDARAATRRAIVRAAAEMGGNQ